MASVLSLSRRSGRIFPVSLLMSRMVIFFEKFSFFVLWAESTVAFLI